MINHSQFYHDFDVTQNWLIMVDDCVIQVMVLDWDLYLVMASQHSCSLLSHVSDSDFCITGPNYTYIYIHTIIYTGPEVYRYTHTCIICSSYNQIFLLKILLVPNSIGKASLAMGYDTYCHRYVSMFLY